MSALVGQAKIASNDPFAFLFTNASALVDASGLELLDSSIFGANAWMFCGCVNLTAAPSALLVGKHAGGQAYRNMFQNCRALSSGPKIEAEMLSAGSLRSMF